MNFPCEPLHPQEAWSQMGAKHGKKTSPLHLTLILDEGLKITRHMNLTSDPSLKPSGWHGWKFISILQHSSVAASVPGVLPIPFPHPCGGPFDGRHQARDDRAGPQDSQAPWSINKHHPWSEIHGALAGRPEGLRTLSRQQGRNVRIPWFLLEPILQSSWSPKKRLGMRRAVARLTLSQQNWKQVNKQAMGDGDGWVESMELHVCQSFLNLSGTGETPPLSETLKRDMKLVEDVSNMYQNVVSGHPSRIKFISCSMVQRCSESRPAKTGLRRGAARRIRGLWLGANRASCDWEMMVFSRGKKGGPPSNPYSSTVLYLFYFAGWISMIYGCQW